MTEQLRDAMHSQARLLDVPPPPTGTILSRGRAVRSRRRWAGAVAAVVVSTVLAGAGATLLAGDDRPSVAEETGPSTYERFGAVAVGRTVLVGDTSVTMERDVHSLHYTSAGVVVRTNDSGGASDGAGPEHFTLVRPDGSLRDLDVVLEDTVPATDPTQPYLVWSEATDEGRFEVVVLDVTDDTEVARVALPEGSRRSFWPTPPVALSGDHVYAGLRDSTLRTDWRTGVSVPVDGLEGGAPEIAGGHAMRGYGKRSEIVDLATGETVVVYKFTEYGSLQLSPDGRFAKAVEEERFPGDADPRGRFRVVTVGGGSGPMVLIDGVPYDYGWSPTGRLVRVDEGALTSCDPRTGACEEVAVDFDPGDGQAVKLGGVSYES